MNRLYVWLKMNRGLFKKIAFYIGMPSLLFLLVVVYLVSSGGISNYSIAGFNTQTMISEKVMHSTRLIVGALLFVILPVFVSVLAIARKSMSYKVAAIVVNFVAVIFISAALNPTGTIGCGAGKKRGGNNINSSGQHGSTEDSRCNPNYTCEVGYCTSECLKPCLDAQKGNTTAWDNSCQDATPSDACAETPDDMECLCIANPEYSPDCACILGLATCEDPYNPLYNLNYSCPETVTLQTILKDGMDAGLSVLEAWENVPDSLITAIASCPLDHLNMDDFVDAVCGGLESEMIALNLKTGLAPVRLGELIGQLDKNIIPNFNDFQKLREVDAGTEKDMRSLYGAYTVPPFYYGLSTNTDAGIMNDRDDFWEPCKRRGETGNAECRYYTNYSTGYLHKNGKYEDGKGTRSYILLKDFLDYSIIDAGTKNKHDWYVSCQGAGGCGPDGDVAVTCSYDAPTGVSLNATTAASGEDILAYSVAVFKPWKRKKNALCNVTTIHKLNKGADSYLKRNLGDAEPSKDNIDICDAEDESCETIDMHDNDLYNCDAVDSLEDKDVFYIPFITGEFCKIPDVPIHNVASYIDKTWVSSLLGFGINDNERYDPLDKLRILSNAEQTLTNLNSENSDKWLGKDAWIIAPSFPVLATSQVIPAGLFGTNDKKEKVVSGFQWNPGSSYLATCWNCAMPSVGSSIFIVDSEKIGGEGGEYELRGVAIGGGQATKQSNQVLAAFALNLTQVALGAKGTLSKLEMGKIYQRKIDIVDYRNPIYAFRELAAKVDMKKHKLYGDDSSYLSPENYEKGYMSSAEVLPEEQADSDNKDKPNAYSFYMHKMRNTDDKTHLQGNFTGQLGRFKTSTIAEMNEAIKKDTGAELKDIIAFDAGNADCLGKIYKYIYKYYKDNNMSCIGSGSNGTLNKDIYGNVARPNLEGYPCETGKWDNIKDMGKGAVNDATEDRLDTTKLAGEGLVMTGLYVATRTDWTLKFDNDGGKKGWDESATPNPGIFPGSVNIGFRELMINNKKATQVTPANDHSFNQCTKQYGVIKGLNSEIEKNSGYVPEHEVLKQSFLCDQYFNK